MLQVGVKLRLMPVTAFIVRRRDGYVKPAAGISLERPPGVIIFKIEEKKTII